MKCKYLSFFIYLFFPYIAFPQNIVGKVIDEDLSPLPFVNVVLLSEKDSSFVKGTTTKENGDFCIKEPDIEKNFFMRISCVGYFTQHLHSIQSDSLYIVLKKDTIDLGEIIVKGKQPIYKMNAGTLQVKIEDTILSEMGTAYDVLTQLPYVSCDINQQVSVIGRGNPVIYIDNRKINNNDELQQLKSHQIKNVEIIINPNNQYAADINSVIRISTLRPAEGISGVGTLQVTQKKKMDLRSLVDISYTKRNLDVFTSIYASKNSRTQDQRDVMTFMHENLLTTITKTGEIILRNKYIELMSGFNYILSKKQSVGMKYIFEKNFSATYEMVFKSHCESQQLIDDDEIIRHGSRNNYSHYLNIYYQNHFSDAVSLNIDGTYDYKKTGQSEDSQNTLAFIRSNSASKSSLWALRTWGEISVLRGKLNIGVETSRTKIFQGYEMMNEEIAKDLPSGNNESTQNLLHLFSAYTIKSNSLNIELGARYELVFSDYFKNGKKSTDESWSSQRVFPSFSFSYNKKRLGVSLSYRTMIQRPSYYQLRSEISYNDKFTYEGGNPALRPAIIHRYTFTLSYKDILLDCMYKSVKDASLFYAQRFNDKNIIFFSVFNNDMKSFSANLSYTPTVYFWHPTFLVGLYTQQLHYEGERYNSPIFVYEWKNLFKLPRDWYISLQIEGQSYGNENLAKSYAVIDSKISIKKTYKNIECYVGVNDIFNSKRERWIMQINGIYYNKWNNPGYRSVFIKISYTFNTIKRKYKGEQSGRSELNRL